MIPCARSAHSLLRGASPPAALVARAAELGMKRLVLADEAEDPRASRRARVLLARLAREEGKLAEALAHCDALATAEGDAQSQARANAIAAEIALLYRRRWQAELNLRSLKIVLQMDHLRCKTPHRVRNEFYLHLVAYNLIRQLMAVAAFQADSRASRRATRVG